MFRVIDRHTDGSLHITTDDAATDALIAMPPAGTVRWIDLQKPDGDALEKLRRAFAFHPLAIADCAAYGRQSRVVEVAGSGATAVSYFAHWTGDRWRRAAIETTFQKSGLCDAMWATYGTAFAGCSNGEMITFQGNVGTSNAVGDAGVAITGLWGFAANDVWAAQGQKVLHYNGTSWPEDSDWAALGVATTGTIVAISANCCSNAAIPAAGKVLKTCEFFPQKALALVAKRLRSSILTCIQA